MPDISRIKLPSGNYYDIKDAVAREMISGGVSFIVGWDGTGTPDATKIPAGVKVTYNSTEYTGTLAVASAQAGAFYLIKSSTQAGVKDAYDEYVVVKPDTSDSTTWYWEKIGDTQIDLTDVVTDVSLSKQTENVMGTSPVINPIQPTVTLSGESSSATGRAQFIQSVSTTKLKGTAQNGGVTPSTTNIKATASGGGAAWNSKDQKTVVTGYTIAAANKDTFVKSVSAETNKNLVTTSITPVNGTETVSKVTKTASKLVTTSITPTNGTESVSKVTQSAGKLETTSITPTNGTESVSKVTKTASKLVQTTVPNVTANENVTASKISSNSSVTANKSTWTFTMGTASGETETLIIGGGNGSDVTATNTAYSDVTASKTTLGTAVTVATGAVNSSGTGSDVVTGVTISDKTVAKAGTAVTVATGAVSANGTGGDVVSSMTISDKTVAKAGSAVTVATGSVASTGTGSDIITAVTVSDKTVAKAGTAVTVATGATDEEGTGDPVVTGVTIGDSAQALISLPTPSTATVIGSSSTFTNTQPTVKLTSGATAVSGTTVEVVDGITSVQQPTITLSTGSDGDVTVATGGTTKYMQATASSVTPTFSSTDTKNVLKSTTDVSVTKGNQ